MWSPLNWLRTQVLGVDLNEEQKRADEAHAFFVEDNLRLYDEGKWTQAQYEMASTNVESAYLRDVAGDVQTAAVDSMKQTLATGSLFDPLLNPFKTLLKQIPWWLWLLAAGVVAWKLGLFDLAKRRIAKLS